MAVPPAIDHVVINALYDMDRAAAAFAALGFTVTPRGHHSLGSINHLMVFGSDYLELIGLPYGVAAPRQEIAASPVGINGLVFRTADADAAYRHLRAIDLAGDPPDTFTRPVALPDGEAKARFRSVKARPGSFAAGRVYFCEHHTPELVWRPEWSAHANGAKGILELVMVAGVVDEEAERLAAVAGVSVADDAGGGRIVALDGAQVSVLSPDRYRHRYGRLALPLDGRRAIFGAVALASADLAGARRAAETAGHPVTATKDRTVVAVPEFDSVIEFRG